jgi:hypothetical protein
MAKKMAKKKMPARSRRADVGVGTVQAPARSTAEVAPARVPAEVTRARVVPLPELEQAHRDALEELVALKRATPRDPDAIVRQKLVVQGVADEIAARAGAGEAGS